MFSSFVNPGDNATAEQYNNLRKDAFVSGFFIPKAKNPPSMSIDIGNGQTQSVGGCTNFSGKELTFTAPSVNPRIDRVVYIDSFSPISIQDYTYTYAINNTPIKIREVIIPITGYYKVVFDLSTQFSSTVYGRIYKNGSAVGTTRSTNSATPVLFTETLFFSAGDLIQLYIWASSTYIIHTIFTYKLDTSTDKIFVIRGTENATPSIPSLPFYLLESNYLEICRVYHRPSESCIQNSDDSTNGYIIDTRGIVFNNGYKYVLSNQTNDVYVSNDTEVSKTNPSDYVKLKDFVLPSDWIQYQNVKIYFEVKVGNTSYNMYFYIKAGDYIVYTGYTNSASYVVYTPIINTLNGNKIEFYGKISTTTMYLRNFRIIGKSQTGEYYTITGNNY